MNKSRLYSMVLSIAVAFGLWLYVVSNVSQQNDLTFYNIPVVREGESVLNERNLMVTSVSANAVSLHLSGARDDLNKVDSSNMIVKLDLSKITEPGEKIPMNYIPSYPTDVASNAFEVTNKNPATKSPTGLPDRQYLTGVSGLVAGRIKPRIRKRRKYKGKVFKYLFCCNKRS